MKQLFYSEKLNRTFDSEADCIAAEAEQEKKLALVEAEKAEKKAAAKEVEEAFKAANDAYKKANEALNEFCKKYGSFHTTITDSSLPRTSLFDLFFDNFWF